MLQKRYHVILPILNGHAGSDKKFLSIEDNANDIIAFIDEHYDGSVGSKELKKMILSANTIAVLIASAFTTIKNKEEVVLFHRAISKQSISKAVAVVSMSFIIMFTSTVLLADFSSASVGNMFRF